MNMKQLWNVQTEGQTSHIDLFGFVGGSKEFNDGFNEKDLLDELRAIPEENALTISINSFGGSVYTALSIYALLKNHKGPVTFRIDGTAMSAATIITSVPNARVIMPRGAIMMIHKVSVGVYGNADDLKKTVEDIEKLEQNVLQIYAEKTGKSIDVIQALVNKETYFTAEEALEFGLVDEIDETTVIENRAEGDMVIINGLELSAQFFEHAPQSFFKTPTVEAQVELPVAKEEASMDLDQLKSDYPELIQAIRNEALIEGAAKERARIQAIEDIAMAGHEALVRAAKFDGTTTAEMLAIQMVKAEKAKIEARLTERVEDAKALEDTHETGDVGLLREKDYIQQNLANHLASICKWQGGAQ